jgi:hypothetical protein
MCMTTAILDVEAFLGILPTTWLVGSWGPTEIGSWHRIFERRLACAPVRQ